MMIAIAGVFVLVGAVVGQSDHGNVQRVRRSGDLNTAFDSYS